MRTNPIDTGHEGRPEARIQEEAFRLTWEAVRQGQRALSGLVAAPTSLALATAATVMHVAAFVEQALQIFQLSLDAVSRGMRQELQRAPERAILRPDEPGDGKLARS